MKQSPNKLVPVLRHKLSVNLRNESKASKVQLQYFKQIMKNSFRIKKQYKGVNIKQLKIQGTITKPRIKQNILIRYNRSVVRSDKEQIVVQEQEDSQTQSSTVLSKNKLFKISQKRLQQKIMCKSGKKITYQKYQSQSKRKIVPSLSIPKNHSINKTNNTTINKDSVLKNRPLLYSNNQNLKNIRAQHYYVYQSTQKQPIIGYRSKTKIQVASLTKIMTFYTLYQIAKQNNIQLSNQKVTITSDLVDIPGTTAYLVEDQVYTLQQLLYGMMLPSGNDAALALAKWGGSILLDSSKNTSYIKQFINRMNQQCNKLDLKDSNFGNPHGLPHIQSRTTCQDMAKLCSVCLQIDIFRRIVSTKIYKYKVYCERTKRKHQFHWENTNKLLRRSGFIGIKTGITVTAGPCLASAYCFRGRIYIVIIAKSAKMSRRFKDTRKLLVHCLNKLYENQLDTNQLKSLKKLDRTNQDIDSDYSDEEQQFDFSKNHAKQLKKRARIITQY